MVPEEIRTALEGLIGGDYARYVILVFFLSSVMLVRFQTIRELWLNALPRRRREREAEQRLRLAQRLCEVEEKQAALGLSFVDVNEIWRARFPEAQAAPAGSDEAPRAVRSTGRLFAYAAAPWLFAVFYGLAVAAVAVALAEYFLAEYFLPMDAARLSRLYSSGALAFLIAPTALVIWSMARVPHDRWEKGYFAVMAAAFTRILWGGFLYIPPLTGLFYLIGIDF